jgi:predicted RNA-binding Zn-ribbon protein involved in translation (DUF1610 family)
MPAPSRTNTAVIIIAVVGVVGAITTWALAPYLLGFFIFAMLGAAMTVTVIQNKNRASLAKCPRCGYNIRGLPKDAEKCPECGWLLANRSNDG